MASRASRFFLSTSSSAITITSSKKRSTGSPQLGEPRQNLRVVAALQQRPNVPQAPCPAPCTTNAPPLPRTGQYQRSPSLSSADCCRMLLMRLFAAARLSRLAHTHECNHRLYTLVEIGQGHCVATLCMYDRVKNLKGNPRSFDEKASQTISDETIELGPWRRLSTRRRWVALKRRRQPLAAGSAQVSCR